PQGPQRPGGGEQRRNSPPRDQLQQLPREQLQWQSPAERLHIDHRDQAPRQQDAQGQREQQCQARQQPGLGGVEEHQASTRDPHGPQGGQLGQAPTGLGQQGDEQRDPGHAQGQGIERRG